MSRNLGIGIAVSTVIWLILPLHAIAQDNESLPWFKGTPLRLGSGFSIHNPSAHYPAGPVIAYDRVRDPTSLLDLKFTATCTSDQKMVDEYTGFNMSLAVRTWFAGGGASVNLEQGRIRTDNQYCILMNVQSEYGSERCVNVRLTEEAETLAKTDPQEFTNRYGTHVVTMVDLGASATAMIKINDVELANEIRKQVAANASGGLFGVGIALDTKISNHLKSRARNRSLVIEFAGTGGDDEKGIADLIESLAKLDADVIPGIQAGLATVVRGHTGNNAVYRRAKFVPYSRINKVCANHRNWGPGGEAYLADLYKEYQQATADLEQTKAHLDELRRNPDGQDITLIEGIKVSLEGYARRLLAARDTFVERHQETDVTKPVVMREGVNVNVYELKEVWKFLKKPTSAQEVAGMSQRIQALESKKLRYASCVLPLSVGVSLEGRVPVPFTQPETVHYLARLPDSATIVGMWAEVTNHPFLVGHLQLLKPDVSESQIVLRIKPNFVKGVENQIGNVRVHVIYRGDTDISFDGKFAQPVD